MHIRDATCDEAAILAPLTWGYYRPLLAMDDAARAELGAVCLAAWRDGRPLGLLISARHKDGGQNLLSLSVGRDHRRQGVGRVLLRALVQARPGPLCTQYSDRLPGADAFATLLRAEGWAAPEAVSRRICGPVRETFSVFRQRAGLLERMCRQGFQVHAWGERAAEILALAERLLADGTAPAWADPRPWLDRLHPQASLALVDAAGAVRGWVVCQHQPSMARWYFPIGWVMEPEAGRGWLLGAYAEGARRLEETHGGDTRVVVESTSGLHAMWRVLDRHFSPHADWADHLMESRRA